MKEIIQSKKVQLVLGIVIGIFIVFSMILLKKEKAIEKMVKEEASSKEINSLIGKKINAIIKVKNIYQDSTDKTNMVYEYSVDTKKAKIQEDSYNKFAIKLWKEHLPNVCAHKKIKKMIQLGVGFRYIYLDFNDKIIADMTIKKEDCDSLK